MNNKTKLIIIVLVLLLAAAAGVVGYDWGSPSSTSKSQHSPTVEEYLIGWELGEEILPYPFVGKFRDCDDGTLYSHYYIEALQDGYDIEIMKGHDPWNPGYEHVWLLVSDNETSMVYDWGLPCEQTELYKGRRITLKQLVYFVYRDL